VLLTTHYLDEAEHLADRVGVLSNGRLVAEGTPDALIAGLADTIVSFSVAGIDPSALDGVLPDDATVQAGQVRFTTSSPTADVNRLTTWAVERGVELQALSVARPTLEDVFLGLADTDEASRAARTP
jgi:ABC-2 type transport system ATP-binding protein